MSDLLPSDIYEKNNKFKKWFSDYQNKFIWTTMDHRRLRIDEMKSHHVFNSMKMIFNHMADQYGIDPVWYTKKYSGYELRSKQFPRELTENMIFFIAIIEQRCDLPRKYWPPYHLILKKLGINDNHIGQQYKELENSNSFLDRWIYGQTKESQRSKI